MSETVDTLLANISGIFRNVLPGFLVLAGAGLAYPSWFSWTDYKETSHLLILIVIAIVAGNTWYVFHRYGVHQIVDCLFYILGQKGPARAKELHYFDDLAKHVVNLRKISATDPVRQHVNLRASSMHLMYIASEVCLVFSVFNAANSFFARHWWEMRLAGFVGLLVTLLQNLITRRIDYYSVETQKAYKTNEEILPIES